MGQGQVWLWYLWASLYPSVKWALVAFMSSLILQEGNPCIYRLNQNLPCSPGEPSSDTHMGTAYTGHAGNTCTRGTHTHPYGDEAQVGERGWPLLVDCSLLRFPQAHVWPSLVNTPQTLTAHHLRPWASYLSASLRGRVKEGSPCQPSDPQNPFPGPRAEGSGSAAETSLLQVA